jgi:hypothetical protein
MNETNLQTQRSPIYNHVTGEVLRLTMADATHRIALDKSWSREPPPPPGWKRQTPQYRATRDLHPPALDRMRHDTPWASTMDENCWQYATGPIADGDLVQTTSWPHESFEPLNYAAKQILNFFNMREKSRMQLSPWLNGEVRLETGTEGMSIPVPHVRPKPSLVHTDS